MRSLNSVNVAQLRKQVGDTQSEADPPTSSTPAGPSAPVPPIQPSLQRANAPPAPPAFEPQCLPHSRKYQLLVDHSSPRLSDPTHGHRLDQQTQSSSSTEDYRPDQPGQSRNVVVPTTCQRCRHILKVAIMMGIPLNLLQKNSDATQLIRVLTLAISMSN